MGNIIRTFSGVNEPINSLPCNDVITIQGIIDWLVDPKEDESERLLYEDCYITHGSYEFYYIYLDESEKPAYCLELDNNLNAYFPTMIMY